MDLSIYLLIIPFVALICYCFILILLFGTRGNRISKHYIYYIIAMIIWSFGSFMMKTSLPPSPLFWNRVLCVGLIAMPAVFYHFTLVLTDTKNQKKTLLIGYLSAIAFILFNFAGWIVKSVSVENYQVLYELEWAASIMAVWSICYLIIALVNIILKVKANTIPFIRVKLIITGLILVIIGGLMNLSNSLGKYPFDIVANTINAIFIAYSIYRYKFLEINLLVRKSLAYSLYTLILTGIYIVTVFALQQFLTNILGLGKNGSITPTLIMAVFLALLFHPVKGWIQKWIDRIFYKERMNHQKLLKDYSKEINNELDLEELTDSLLRTINEGLQPSQISLMLRDGNDEYRMHRCGKIETEINDVIYNGSHPIIQWFKDGNPMLTMSEIESSALFTSLWSMEKNQLRRLNTEFIVPITLREQPIGLMLLGEKKGGEPYSQEEMDLLFTLLNNAAVVIENAQLYVAAKQQAITDGLTKLYNHRYFHEALSELIFGKKTEVFSVAMIDVDLFKLYNDLYGHSAGDRALEKIANILRASLPKEDIITRYGGEEFAVIFPGIEGGKSLQMIENLRKIVENSFMASKKEDEFLTISAGVASYPMDGTTAEDIIEHADTAMYAAKRNGRNQCIMYSSIAEDNNAEVAADTIYDMQESIKSAYLSSTYALAATIDAKDHFTYGHSENVSRYAVALAEAAGFNEEILNIVKIAGLLHDIGKIGIPEDILTKKTKLTQEEYDIMKKHVDISITIIKHIPSLVNVIPAIMSHHERYDGHGYPRGIRGENIPVVGRCLCIVDAFDAMTMDRPYRRAISPEQAIEELKNNAGTQFDPELTKIFVKLFEEGKVKVIRNESKA